MSFQATNGLNKFSAYFRQALLFSVGVLLGAIAIHVGLHFPGKFASRQLTHWLGDSLAIFASVLGVGIGFGTQNIANNLISGLILISIPAALLGQRRLNG